MSALLERRMEQFQYKVQQNINLADDEISRLAGYLSVVRGDITDAQDQLNRISLKTTQLEQQSAGREKRHKANLDTFIASMNTRHHRLMQELQERHAQELSSIHQSFRENIAQIEQLMHEKIQQKTGPVEDLLKKTQTQYQKLVDTQGISAKSLEADALEDIRGLQELEFQRQKRLEATLAARNQERLDSLLQGKARLSDCVNTLEEMERNHASSMETYKTKLETMDQCYHERVKRETERHSRVVESLKRKQSEIEKRADALQKTVQRIQKCHKRQVEDAVREGEMLRTTIESTEAKSQQGERETAKVQEWTNKLQQLKKKLENSENTLMQARTDNETMKREIARLKHEAVMATRRGHSAGL